MIKPQDIPAIASANSKDAERDLHQRQELELMFDKAITAAAETGVWPARIALTRSGFLSHNTGAVAEMYRSEGWSVHDGLRDSLFTIDMPRPKT